MTMLVIGNTGLIGSNSVIDRRAQPDEMAHPIDTSLHAINPKSPTDRQEGPSHVLVQGNPGTLLRLMTSHATGTNHVERCIRRPSNLTRRCLKLTA